MPDLITTFTRLTRAVAAVVETEPDPNAETPCPAWDYGQLLAHLVGGDRLFAAILSAGESAPLAEPRVAAPTPADYRSASHALLVRLADPGLADRVIQAPVGALTGAAVVALRATEHLLHGWDLARSAGAPVDDLAPVAAALAEPAGRLLAGLGEAVAARRPFGEPVPVAEDATPLDRLVARFGRDPGWQPDPKAGYDRLLVHFSGRSRVEIPDGSRRGYGAMGLRIDNAVFACPHQGRLMLKLSQSQVDDLIGSGIGRPLAQPGRRPMRQWVTVPLDGAATRRAEQAYAFALGGHQDSAGTAPKPARRRARVSTGD